MGWSSSLAEYLLGTYSVPGTAWDTGSPAVTKMCEVLECTELTLRQVRETMSQRTTPIRSPGSRGTLKKVNQPIGCRSPRKGKGLSQCYRRPLRGSGISTETWMDRSQPWRVRMLELDKTFHRWGNWERPRGRIYLGTKLHIREAASPVLQLQQPSATERDMLASHRDQKTGRDSLRPSQPHQMSTSWPALSPGVLGWAAAPGV